MTVNRTRATPLYPGIFFPESGSAIEVTGETDDAIVARFADDAAWFALEIETADWQTWTAENGETNDQIVRSTRTTRRIYAGTEILDEDAVKALGSDYGTLATNMQVNGWNFLVRTRRGNFQPLLDEDSVALPVAEVTA